MKIDEVAAVIFDWDGVLFDSIPEHRRINKEIQQEMGLPKIHFDGRPYERVLRDHGISWREIRRYAQRWIEKESAAPIRIFPGTNATLVCFANQGIVLGMLTNRGALAYNIARFEHSGVAWTLFDFVITYERSAAITTAKKWLNLIPSFHHRHLFTEYPKPSPRAVDPARSILRQAAKQKGCRKILCVGDSEADWNCAKGNGFEFVAVKSGQVQDEEVWRSLGVKHVINSVTELPSIFE